MALRSLGVRRACVGSEGRGIEGQEQLGRGTDRSDVPDHEACRVSSKPLFACVSAASEIACGIMLSQDAGGFSATPAAAISAMLRSAGATSEIDSIHRWNEALKMGLRSFQY